MEDCNRYWTPRISDDRRKNVCGRRLNYQRFDGIVPRNYGYGIVDTKVSIDPRKIQRRQGERRSVKKRL